MNIHQITPTVSYVGVNDRNTDRFEGLWPLPYGVSYNSYLVKGEKTALVDTVEIKYVEDFIRHIKREGMGGTIDYLVVNHMEPDHSGSIPVIMETFPEAKIVGNKQTIGMVKGFYHIEDDSRFHEVADNSTLDLGNGVVLKFVLTPMVHWPETMVTYYEKDKILFSGDAFGTFGALNGGVTDYETETDIHIQEMYRYYSNIVGKYGKFVQRALDKCKTLDIKYLCSTHGPIWRDRAGEVIGIYDRLSSYRSEDGVVIVYGSMYGNTAEVAEEIACRLAEKGIKKIIVHNANKTNLSYIISDAYRYKALIVGSATYSMRLLPPVEQFLNALHTREVKDKIFAAFGSFTWAQGALPQIISEFSAKTGIEAVASFTMKQSANEQTMADIEMLADKVAECLKNNDCL